MSDNEALNEAMYQCSACGPNHEPGSSKHFSRNPAQASTLVERLRRNFAGYPWRFKTGRIAEGIRKGTHDKDGNRAAPTSTLVERLRADEETCLSMNCLDNREDAADRIEELERESASYEAEAGSERRRAASAEAERDEYRARYNVEAELNKGHEAERDRLRAALVEILPVANWGDTLALITITEIAERALEGEK